MTVSNSMGQTSDDKRQPSEQAKELAMWRKKGKIWSKSTESIIHTDRIQQLSY